MGGELFFVRPTSSSKMVHEGGSKEIGDRAVSRGKLIGIAVSKTSIVPEGRQCLTPKKAGS